MATRGRPRIYPDLRTQWRERQRRYRKAKQQRNKVYQASITASATFGYSASPDNVTMALQ